MQTMITVPDVVKKRGVNRKYLQEVIAALLYSNGKLSEKDACDMIGATRRYFEETILPKFRLSLTGGTPEDVTFETGG